MTHRKINEEDWSIAFLKQARSDLKAYNHIASGSLPPCHRLHYLQMWLEKLCKAKQFDATRRALPGFQKSHDVVAKVLPQLIKGYLTSTGQWHKSDWKTIRELCAEIDLLHPANTDGGKRQDNVEYPWATFVHSRSMVVAPTGWKFRIAERLDQPAGRKLMKAATAITNAD